MKPKELRDVSFGDIFNGRVELPEGVTRQKMLGVLLQIELHQILTHSRVERERDGVCYYFHGKLRATGHMNAAGHPDGELRILCPNGKLWILAAYRNGQPVGNWSEHLPDGTKLPGL